MHTGRGTGRGLAGAGVGAGGAPTLEDVARAAGVSRATVSRVVNGVRNVDPAIRQAVLRAVAATGYVPNRAARSLVTRRSGTVALVVSGAGAGAGAGSGEAGARDGFAARVFEDPFFGRVVSGVVRALRPAGVHPVLMFADTGEDRAEVLAYLAQGSADGALLVTTHPRDPLPGMVAAAGLPAVLFARPAPGVALDHVDLRHREGGALAARHLLGLGRGRLAAIGGPADLPASRERLAGFHETATGGDGGDGRNGQDGHGGDGGRDSRDGGDGHGRRAAGDDYHGQDAHGGYGERGSQDGAAAEDGGDGGDGRHDGGDGRHARGRRHPAPRRPAAVLRVAEGDFTLDGGERAMRCLLVEQPDLDGVFAANDLMAQGACLVLREHGRRIPEDVAVVGFDDSAAASACRPRLTTVRQPVEDMAAEMVRLLLDRVAGTAAPERASVLFAPALVVLDSA
ncbi:LacI family DNA-binding transcriptional regulator [Streptomyces subrutilus]|uniref:LacI family DNA-binding transcriptional regulator n=1 Tax=Streptomyces subrutilus TaxID=36818 RepID=UPI000A55CD7C|nr:LacI family DNA-binding transcriptional regulator [Streptomyces subrutilus]